ncbi:MAG: SDR family oxidoreductase [Bacteroidota bacterium]
MDQEKRLRIALVTGANRGIGFAVAKGLLQQGVTVIATGRKLADLKQAAEELRTHGQLSYQQLDVTNHNSISASYNFVAKEFGRLDYLINNAGINYDTWHNVQNADLDEVRQTIETNTMGPWQMINTFLPLLRNSEAASIVNVSIGAGDLNRQNGTTPGYSLSKLALNGLTLQFSHALAADGIIVNSVCPGWVRTNMGGMQADRSPEEGAETIIWAATMEERVSGKFFRDKVEIEW